MICQLSARRELAAVFTVVRAVIVMGAAVAAASGWLVSCGSQDVGAETEPAAGASDAPPGANVGSDQQAIAATADELVLGVLPFVIPEEVDRIYAPMGVALGRPLRELVAS